jgi:hypothetical protein
MFISDLGSEFFSFWTVLRIRIRKDPKLLTGSDPDPKPNPKTGSEINL